MEKLQPQIPLSNLNSVIDQNYQNAQNYYKQRREAFRTFLTSKAINLESGFEQAISDNIEKIWNKQIFNVMSGIYWQGKQNGLNASQLEAQVRSVFTADSKITEYLVWAIKQDNPRTFYSGLGQAFEEWLQSEGIDPVINKGAAFIDGHTNQLIKTFVTGSRKSKSSVVSGVKNIRPDLIVSDISMELTEDDGVLYSSTGLPVELQSTLNVNWENLIPAPDEMISDHSILQEFLDPVKGSFFGLSAKSWKNSNGKVFSHSSVLEKMLNATFNQVDSKGQRHSWQPHYTMQYVVYFLSHKIFDIVGPTNVAMVARDGFTWMDEFLTTRMFFMRVQLEEYYKGRDGGEDRAFPQIEDPGIYIRNYNSAKDFSNIKARQHNTRTKGRFISLRLT